MSDPDAATLTLPEQPALPGRVVERSDRVLWTLSGSGIVLHNFEQRRFLELGLLGYLLWGFLDGGRSVEEAIARACEGLGASGPATSLERQAWETVAVLVENGFVDERSADA